MMHKRQTMNTTSLVRERAYEGERIEQKIYRITQNKEPITDGAPLIYTERKLGVQPAYNIRTDRFEIAVEAMDKVTKSHLAKREWKPTTPEKDKQGDGHKTTPREGEPKKEG